jgi:hypothetical protein
MKLTKSQLKKIIKEEIGIVLREFEPSQWKHNPDLTTRGFVPGDPAGKIDWVNDYSYERATGTEPVEIKAEVPLGYAWYWARKNNLDKDAKMLWLNAIYFAHPEHSGTPSPDDFREPVKKLWNDDQTNDGKIVRKLLGITDASGGKAHQLDNLYHQVSLSYNQESANR